MLISEITLPLEEGAKDPNIFKAIFLAGPPGAGKNTVIERLDLFGKGLKLQDVDHTVSFLNKRVSPTDPDYEKGLDITLRRQSLFEKNMLGLIINTTGRDYQSLTALNKKLKDIGYDTFMLFVDCEYDIAVKRISDRKTSATNPRDTGRKVDMPYFNDAYENSKKNIEFFAMTFGNQFTVVTNNELTDSENLPARQIFEKTLTDASKKVDRFLKKPLTPKAQELLNQFTTNL